MANRFWVGDTDGTWNDANNWASTSGGAGGAGVPTSSDDVIFDDQYTTQNCTCDVAIDILSLDVQSTYDGTLDFADSAYAHAVGGDFTCDGGGTVDLGDATITCSGNLDNKDQTTWTRGTSTVVMDGSSKSLTLVNANHFYHLTVDGTIAIDPASGSGTRIYGNLTINNGGILTLDQNVNWNYMIAFVNNGTLTVQGTITVNAAGLTASPLGTINGNTSGNFGIWSSGSIGGGTISIPFSFDSSSGSQTLTITGNVIFSDNFQYISGAGETVNIDNSGNYDLTFQGDIVASLNSGTFTWAKGTGTITFSGTANQDIDFNGEIVEDIDLDKSAGTVTLTGELITDSFTGTAGTLDIDGNDLSTIANFTAADGTSFLDAAGGGLVTVSGNFALNGSAP